MEAGTLASPAAQAQGLQEAQEEEGMEATA